MVSLAPEGTTTRSRYVPLPKVMTAARPAGKASLAADEMASVNEAKDGEVVAPGEASDAGPTCARHTESSELAKLGLACEKGACETSNAPTITLLDGAANTGSFAMGWDAPDGKREASKFQGPNTSAGATTEAKTAKLANAEPRATSGRRKCIDWFDLRVDMPGSRSTHRFRGNATDFAAAHRPLTSRHNPDDSGETSRSHLRCQMTRC
mmetsp:Transcript_83786/g.240889  ORF Transcript_83786/g.240889 Transcript_83786/m.240889 type:complete len:209 (-) Transcript_83786:17-643(-)